MYVRYTKRWLILAAGIALLFSLDLPLPAAEADLSGEEVSQLISGNTVEAVHALKGYPIITYYLSDGSFRQLRDGEPAQGTWSIDEQGQLCTFRQGWGGECRVISREGRIWKAYKIPKNMMKPRLHKRTYNKILPGNPHKL